MIRINGDLSMGDAPILACRPGHWRGAEKGAGATGEADGGDGSGQAATNAPSSGVVARGRADRCGRCTSPDAAYLAAGGRGDTLHDKKEYRAAQVIGATVGRLVCVIETAGSIPEMNPAQATTASGGFDVPKRETSPFNHLHKRRKLSVQKLCNGYIGFNENNAAFDLLAKGSVLHRVLQAPA